MIILRGKPQTIISKITSIVSKSQDELLNSTSLLEHEPPPLNPLTSFILLNSLKLIINIFIGIFKYLWFGFGGVTRMQSECLYSSIKQSPIDVERNNLVISDLMFVRISLELTSIRV